MIRVAGFPGDPGFLIDKSVLHFPQSGHVVAACLLNEGASVARHHAIHRPDPGPR
jgi:hypothetical protein